MSPHSDRHDPTLDHAECFVCEQALGAAFAKLADLDLGPSSAARLIAAIRRIALDEIAVGAAS